MPLTWNTTELVARVKLRARIPGTESDGTADSDIVSYLNDAMDEEIVPYILSHREDYYVLTEKINMVANTSRYRLPKRAIVNKIREIKYRNGTGTSPNDDYDLPIIAREHLDRWNSNSGTSGPGGFYFEDVDIVLVPENLNASGSIIVSYYFRPSDLVESTAVRKITVVNTSTKVLTVDSTVPAAWTTANKFDVHSPDSGGEIRMWSRSISDAGGVLVTFNDAIDGSVVGEKQPQVGDYLALEGECFVPQIPKVFHPVLVRAAAASILRDHGDFEAAEAHEKFTDKAFSRYVRVFEDRAVGEPESVVNPDSVWYGGVGRNRGGTWG
jgi:hypothetical protein